MQEWIPVGPWECQCGADRVRLGLTCEEEEQCRAGVVSGWYLGVPMWMRG